MSTGQNQRGMHQRGNILCFLKKPYIKCNKVTFISFYVKKVPFSKCPCNLPLPPGAYLRTNMTLAFFVDLNLNLFDHSMIYFGSSLRSLNEIT